MGSWVLLHVALSGDGIPIDPRQESCHSGGVVGHGVGVGQLVIQQLADHQVLAPLASS